MAKADHQIEGLEIRFYPNEHEPVHFHARKKGEWEIKVYFRLCSQDTLDYDLKWTLKAAGPSSTELRQLCQYVQKYRDHLEIEWEDKVCKN